MDLDKELINYLMTSDFTEDLTTDKLKELLKSFRQFYRYQNGKMNALYMELSKTNDRVNNLDEKLKILQEKLEEKIIELEQTKNRKLSFMERIKGKINK